jgi:hypothetical protein
MAVKLAKQRRHLSVSAIRSIRKAQKRRWAKFHEEQTNGTVKVIPKKDSRFEAFRFLSERSKIYNSPMEAYLDGFLDGRSSK